ncbi:MAG TPA: hypothetical protein VN920_17205 [Pyrinomonadaceae bacterium]|nr:hypothetical protein [Pyrinomonadaceae bacterium]
MVICKSGSSKASGKYAARFSPDHSLSADRILLLGLTLVFASAVTFASPQKTKAVPIPTGPLLTKTTTRHEVRRFSYGGTFTVVGAPQGSIFIEGWTKNEVDVTAEIELHATSESDFDRLAAVNNFIFDEDANHLRILTTGMHDKSFLRRVAKDFPKALLGLPWRIDYHIRVPVSTDLEINAGSGTIGLSGVEGAIIFTAAQTDASLTLTGGIFTATVALGKVSVSIPGRSWRGSGVDIQLANGDLSVELPVGFSGDIDADILRSGKIAIAFPGLEAREKPGVTERSMRARAGAGGATLRFTVGDGTIYIKKKIEE